MHSPLTDNFFASSFVSIFLSGSSHLSLLLAEYLSSVGLSFLFKVYEALLVGFLLSESTTVLVLRIVELSTFSLSFQRRG